YRFVGNTFLLAPGSGAAFRIFDGIESVEMHDNVFYRAGGGGIQIVRDAEASWVAGVAISGSNNWIPEESTDVPEAWTRTFTGAAPGFSNVDALDLFPAAGSALIDHGSSELASPAGRPFPSPLAAPLFLPPLHRLEPVGGAVARRVSGPLDIGAFEFLSPA